MPKNLKPNPPVVYQTKSGAIALKGDFKTQTLWATQAQIISIFEIDQSVVSRHIKNILNSREVDKKSNMQKMHIANSDKPVVLYSLDIILAVGYRANSAKAIAFRQWATTILRQYIIEGFAVDRKKIASNYGQFLQAVESMKHLLPPNNSFDNQSILELVQLFADTWVSLDAYDKDMLPTSGVTKKQVILTGDELTLALTRLKNTLIKKGEATELFGQERVRGSIQGIVGNVMQSFGGQDVYKTVEEKAANLLYFMVRNHPFTDGNKRSGAFSFVWFLRKAKILNSARLTPEALTALTLLVAESDPQDNEQVLGLIRLLIGK